MMMDGLRKQVGIKHVEFLEGAGAQFQSLSGYFLKLLLLLRAFIFYWGASTLKILSVCQSRCTKISCVKKTCIRRTN